MSPIFFDQPKPNQLLALADTVSKPSSYDLQVKPNLVVAGLEAEVREDVTILSVKYPSGTSARRHATCVVVQTPSHLWFGDRWGGIHPID